MPLLTSPSAAASMRPARRAIWPTLRRALLLAAAAAASACTTLPGLAPAGPRNAVIVADEEGCLAWTAALDAAVREAGVADAEAERMAGLPGLRVDRVGQALLERALADRAAWRAWLARAAALDRAARRVEIDNLPEEAFLLGMPAAREADRAAARARTDRCRELAVRQLETRGPADQALAEALRAQAVVPDRYSTASRALGLYPLLRWPFFAGVQGWQDEQAASMRRWAATPPPLARHVPAVALRDGADALPAAAHAPGGAAVADAGALPHAVPTSSAPVALPAPRDALGLPRLTPAQAQRLLAQHAPVIEVEERGPFDRFGRPLWPGADGAPGPRVDTTQGVVYTRIAHTRFEERWLLQLVYTLWFPERPARSSWDLLAGALDGVVVRLTLDESGRPLLMDTIHACGCYHMFFASAALVPREGAPRHEEWLFAPMLLPELGIDERLVVRISSASHDVSGLARAGRAELARPAASGVLPGSYELLDEAELRSLPLPPQQASAPGMASSVAPARTASPSAPAQPRRSLYAPDGLVRGTERGERFLFWPMGIASAGAMRQWGHHATAFVGRRHFDDVDLIEQRFVRAGSGATALADETYAAQRAGIAP